MAATARSEREPIDQDGRGQERSSEQRQAQPTLTEEWREQGWELHRQESGATYLQQHAQVPAPFPNWVQSLNGTLERIRQLFA